LDRTETFIPMKPAAPESTEPKTKPAAEMPPSVAKMMAATTTPTTPMVEYCRLR